MECNFKRKFTGLWIPLEILKNKKLSGIAKILLAEIDSLDCEIGCYATNEHFIDVCGCSERTVTRLLIKLEKLGLIYYDEKSTATNRILHSSLNGNAPETNVPESVKESKSKRFIKPTLEEIQEYCDERNNGINAEDFFDHYEANGWVVGKTPMKDWKASIRTWERNSYHQTTPRNRSAKPNDNLQERPTQEMTFEIGEFLDLWEKALGMRPEESNDNLVATKKLLDELGIEKTKALIYALVKRNTEKYVIREVREVVDPAGLYRNRQYVWDFFSKNAKKWKEWEEKARLGKKPWEL